MTLDKIKHYMDESVYKHWTDGVSNNKNLEHNKKNELLTSAKKDLEKELKQGALNGIKYEAELKLLNHLLS
jgi:hypothetical protein